MQGNFNEHASASKSKSKNHYLIVLNSKKIDTECWFESESNFECKECDELESKQIAIIKINRNFHFDVKRLINAKIWN